MAKEQKQGRSAPRKKTDRPSHKKLAALSTLFIAVFALSAGGWWLVLRDISRVPTEAARIAGLSVHLDEARWVLDQMDHGENYNKPAFMMPDMPEWGKQRVTVDLIFTNPSDFPQDFEGSEFFLVPERGESVPPVGAQVGYATLLPGQTLNTALHFDFDTTAPHGQLRLQWRRADETAWLPIPQPVEHAHLRPRPFDPALPPEARLVTPLGDLQRGEDAFVGRFGCGACHGDPASPGTNNVGPHLGYIGVAAAQRIDGMSAEQYIYESITQPSSHIAPVCAFGLPCEAPTAMPDYLSLMNLQEVADLLVYLLAQQTPQPNETDREAPSADAWLEDLPVE